MESETKVYRAEANGADILIEYSIPNGCAKLFMSGGDATGATCLLRFTPEHARKLALEILSNLEKQTVKH